MSTTFGVAMGDCTRAFTFGLHSKELDVDWAGVVVVLLKDACDEVCLGNQRVWAPS